MNPARSNMKKATVKTTDFQENLKHDWEMVEATTTKGILMMKITIAPKKRK